VDVIARWKRVDEKIRVHNLARKIALMAHKEARRDFVDGLEKHKPEFIARFKRVMTWYWRSQRKRQAQVNSGN